MIKKLSIRMKMILLLVVALAIVITILTVSTISLFKTEVQSILQNQTEEKVAFLNKFLDNYLTVPINLVENTAESVKKTTDPQQLEALEEELVSMASSLNGVLGLHVAFSGDRMLYSSGNVTLGSDYDANTREWYTEAIANPDEVVVTDPYVDALTGKLIVGISKVIADGNGVVTLDLDLAFLEDIVSTINIGEEGYTFVYDAYGNVLYHPNYEQNKSMKDVSFYESFIENTYLETESDGKRVFINRFYNEQMNWQIGSIYPYSEIQRAYQPIVTPAIFMNIGGILLLSLIIFYLTTYMLRPLQQVTVFAEKVAQGNLKERIVIKTEDEIGQLSAGFNNMTTGLKTMIRSVDTTADQLNTFSNDVSASVEENVQSIQQVVEHIQTVANHSREQVQATSTVKLAVDNMGESVAVMSANVDDVKGSTLQAEQHTTDGAKLMFGVKGQMEQIERSAKQTADNFNELITVANEINSFSKVISGIADQTNLLALNASIEAARAGEHGAGFAVVADEVRKLAEQTNSSASEIQQLVATIQQTGVVANASIEQSQQAVAAGTAQITSASEMFGMISSVMYELTKKVQLTQEAIQTLHVKKHEATQAVTEINDATARVNNSIEQVAATTEEQNASMEQMAVSAEQLATQAQDLQELIKKFEI